MSDLKNNIDRLVQLDCSLHYQNHPGMVQVQILKQELKKEKLRDKIVYQSVKEKISTQ